MPDRQETSIEQKTQDWHPLTFWMQRDPQLGRTKADALVRIDHSGQEVLYAVDAKSQKGQRRLILKCNADYSVPIRMYETLGT